MGRTTERRDRSRELRQSHEVQEAKDLLMAIETKIRDDGLQRDAFQLASIIGRLESWQCRR